MSGTFRHDPKYMGLQHLTLHCTNSDTRVLVTATHNGNVIPMTEHHHPDARSEAVRLRRMMGGLITDSFGEVRYVHLPSYFYLRTVHFGAPARWMGALANTRSLGDLKYKPLGVTPEPEVRTMLLEGKSHHRPSSFPALIPFHSSRPILLSRYSHLRRYILRHIRRRDLRSRARCTHTARSIQTHPCVRREDGIRGQYDCVGCATVWVGKGNGRG